MSPMAVERAICETYEALTEHCSNARKEWNERRAEISELGLRGKGIDDELRCLQARFAKSCAMVRNHLRDCDSCKSSRRTDERSRHESHAGIFPEFRFSLFSGSHVAGR
jgi:hypothetical protein